MITIRNARQDDLDQLTRIEAICFPSAEAADRQSIEKRLKVFAEHFLIAQENEKPIGFINGMITDSQTIYDEMYENTNLHDENGQWQSIFGLDVLPEYRNRGYATMLMNQMISRAKDQKRLGCILTCKEHLIHYYEKFGYECMGISESTHGNTTWYDMILKF